MNLLSVMLFLSRALGGVLLLGIGTLFVVTNDAVRSKMMSEWEMAAVFVLALMSLSLSFFDRTRVVSMGLAVALVIFIGVWSAL